MRTTLVTILLALLVPGVVGCSEGSSECSNDCGPCGQSGGPATATHLYAAHAYWAADGRPAVAFVVEVAGQCPWERTDKALVWASGSVALLDAIPPGDASRMPEVLGYGAFGFEEVGLTVTLVEASGRLQATFDASDSHVVADCGVLTSGAVLCDGL